MFDFSSLNILNKHLLFLQKKLNAKKPVFLVGWCIRDIILWLDKNPLDIDITLAGKPEEIYKKISKVWLSHFITEKFGTITLIKKNAKKNSKKDQKNNEIKYEITPLRTEWWYEDFRHPGQITRSNDIILDSKRRDFSINAMYYFSTNLKIKKNTKSNIEIDIYSTKIIDKLTKNWIIFLEKYNLLIIQDHKIISDIFADWEYNTKQLNMQNNLHNLWISDLDNISFLLDPQQWLQSISHKKLTTVGLADNRFQEDALRIIRALRFVNVINQKLQDRNKNTHLFDFEKDTWKAIKKNKNLLENIAKERIKEELTKVFAQWNPFWFISLLDESNLLEFLFPSLYAIKFIPQPIRYHPFDVYSHTLLTLFELQKINKDYLVRFGMLYHDVGKLWQYQAYWDDLDKNQIRAIIAWPLNHRRSWPWLVQKDFSALWFSKKETEEIARYVENHHKPEEILSNWNLDKIKKKLRKFLSEAGYQRVENILDITMADRLGQYNPLQNSADLSDINLLRKLLKQINKEEWQFVIKDLVINGNDLIEKFSLTPGPEVGELIKQAFDRVINDIKNRNTKKEILTYLDGYRKMIKNREKNR